ncbi:hypothetical protein KNO15_21490 [Leifsonia shinshuensis]|uniref:hypothetical protein n=1 Tax=Leifsonia shinshuensis TaxID=150026 RepID=UPI001F5124E5|nr:hypothetical protein [Leifsonia shinshuensis]MCI0159282.1 hypothetical protein [Leifsonia shinshuensis]
MTTRLVPRTADALLTLAAAAGALCIVGAILAVVFHVGLILFSTGSMSPTIPAGAVALVRAIPASEVRPGDVVTVDRPGELPITHRVVSAIPAGNGITELVLRGDANAADDPAPYRVTQVRIVVASVPGGAQAVAFASSPVFLGAATLGAAALVGWAFWPREDRARRAARGRHRTPGSGAAAVAVILAGTGIAVCALVAGPAPGAHAATVVTTTSSRYLTLTSVADPERFAALRPGAPVRWTVGISAHPPTPATIRLGLTATGALTPSLIVSVIACPAPWAGTTCPGAPETLLQATPAAALPGSAPRPIGSMPSTAQRWLAVDVVVAPGSTSRGSAELAVWAWGAGDSVSASTRPNELADTGAGVPELPLLLAGGAIAAGTTAAAFARSRRRPS